jgi:UDP-glucose 4-epimerase
MDLGGDVFALSRSGRVDGLSQGLKTHAVDLQDQVSVESAIRSIRPQIVFHLAGLVNTQQDLNLVIPTFGNNLAGSIYLFLALAQLGCERVVVAGSSEEPDVSRFGSSPNSPYAAAKDALTSYARMFHKVFSLPVVVARPYMSYGPYQITSKIIPYTITSLLNGVPPQISSGRRICDLIYIQDLTMALLLTGLKPGLTGEVIDLGTGIGTTIYDAVQLIMEIIESPHHAKFGAIPDRLYEYPQIADIAKTKDLIGFEPNWSLREGLTSTIAWYRSQIDAN